MKRALVPAVLVSAAIAAACSSTSSEGTGEVGLRFRSDVTPITKVEDAKPGVFIPAFEDCRAPLAGEAAGKRDGKVCSNVSIAGATEPGRAFGKYAACDVVRTQRPYWPAKRAEAPKAEPASAAHLAEVEWARGQVAATGCACCHDASLAPRGASKWDIGAPGNWLETVSNDGLALFAGLADSSVLGAYPAADNHGFDRTAVGLPSTEPARMRKLVVDELARRGVTEEQARAVKPFGGPIYEASVRAPQACGAGEGVAPDGKVSWKGGAARYLYVLEVGSKNPGVPPNLDRPAGTVWRLDVTPDADALAAGVAYGTTPEGSFQDTPARTRAPALVKGTKYTLVALRDVGVPLTSCNFTFGEPLATVDPPSPKPPTTSAWGRECKESKECAAEASYCALMPGKTTGYCTATGCKTNASVCPEGWGCFDVSAFQPGAPSICTKP